MSENVILEMKDITKIYPNGVIANENINFSLKKGEIHGLIGENGAGKTTLMKILFGLEKQTEGSVNYNGNPLNISSPLEAIEAGIGMVHQHFMLVPSLTVSENLLLGIEPTRGLSINKKEAMELTKEISLKYNLPVPPNLKIEDLSIGLKQRVEILKTLARDAKVIILDEPTAVLTPQETEELFNQLLELKNLGHTIVFISHKLNEVKKICDRITVLRRGKSIITENVQNLSIEDISKLMIGKDLPERELKLSKMKTKQPLLTVTDLSYLDLEKVEKIKNLNLIINAGEIVGVAGVEGNGQKELSDIITGNIAFNERTTGTITLEGAKLLGNNIRNIRESGISYIPEDRMEVGTAPDMSIHDNIISDRYYFSEYSNYGLLNSQKLKTDVEKLINEFNVKCDGSDDLMSFLSGGNMQKIVVAREFSSNSQVIVANQPTRGIDIGSATFIRNKLVQLASESNKGILLISADLDELLTISDRIIVMYEGEIVGEFEDLDKVDEFELGEYMLGLKKNNEIDNEVLIHAS